MSNWFREQRGRLRLSQREIASRVGVTDWTVGRWEAFASLPDLLLLSELSATYETSADEIIHRVGELAKQIIKQRVAASTSKKRAAA